MSRYGTSFRQLCPQPIGIQWTRGHCAWLPSSHTLLLRAVPRWLRWLKLLYNDPCRTIGCIEQTRFLWPDKDCHAPNTHPDILEINDLVDVSRIQAGKLDLRVDQVDLVVIVREAVEVQQQAESERTIRFQCPPDLSVPVYADAGRIEQVVTNYLTNALKYSPGSRPVEVGIEVEPEDQHARVWVRDQGPGLPAEEQEHIWERFHRVKGIEVQSGTGVGLGLGLHISRIIVERHHGKVGVESAAGKGSTFWFAVPLNSSTSDMA